MPWFAFELDGWPDMVALLEATGAPWPEGACVADLRAAMARTHLAELKARREATWETLTAGLPSRRRLAARWRWSDWAVRELLADVWRWVPPHLLDVAVAVRSLPTPSQTPPKRLPNGTSERRQSSEVRPNASQTPPNSLHTRASVDVDVEVNRSPPYPPAGGRGADQAASSVVAELALADLRRLGGGHAAAVARMASGERRMVDSVLRLQHDPTSPWAALPEGIRRRDVAVGLKAAASRWLAIEASAPQGATVVPGPSGAAAQAEVERLLREAGVQLEEEVDTLQRSE